MRFLKTIKYSFFCHLFFVCFLTIPSFSQYSKGVDKILELYRDEPDKALFKFNKFLNKRGSNTDWDLYVRMYLYRYRIANDSLKNSELSDVYYNEFIAACKKATLKAHSQDGSVYLRKYLVDIDPDKDINYNAKKYLQEAEKYFAEKKYVKAVEYYTKAIDADAKYYKPHVYVGLCYMNLRRYEGAKLKFLELTRKYPTLYEPKEYLVDAYIEAHEYKEAYPKCIEALLSYPSNSMFNKLTFAMSKQQRAFNRHWFAREHEINIPGKEQLGELPEPWNSYRLAKEEILPYCDEFGVIVKKNDLTEAQFMEVYAWEKLLENPGAIGPHFNYAKKVQKRGYLDCFVFLSLFHHDLYEQYKVFIQKNQRRARTYFNNFLLE